MQITTFSPYTTGVPGRGFLPQRDPVTHFPESCELAVLDQLGAELPGRLQDENYRRYAKNLKLPAWSVKGLPDQHLAYQRLYYIRLGFLASGYINQTGHPTANLLPENIARPLVDICQHLNRPPILSYDGYALYNWYRLDKKLPIELGNIDTLQNFVDLYDEHWFILVHVEIEALASDIVSQIMNFPACLKSKNSQAIDSSLCRIADCINQQERVLQRIPERMNPALYFKIFRPYIRFFENVRYQGVDMKSIDYRGETGAQSSIMPMLVAFMKILHKPSVLTNHLMDMRYYMPQSHRELIQHVEAFPDFKQEVSADPFNRVLEAMAEFRRVHYGWAQEYIQKRTDDPRGTGGTPYMQWLEQLIQETLNHRK